MPCRVAQGSSPGECALNIAFALIDGTQNPLTSGAANKKLNMDLLAEIAAMLAAARDEGSTIKYLLAEIMSEVNASR